MATVANDEEGNFPLNLVGSQRTQGILFSSRVGMSSVEVVLAFFYKQMHRRWTQQNDSAAEMPTMLEYYF
jgi:hypothetical protein